MALAPVGSVVLCSWIANSHGSKVDEGSVHPSVIGRKDYGQLLYRLGVLSWLMLLTVPGRRVRLHHLAGGPSGSSLELAQAAVDPRLLTVRTRGVGSHLNFQHSDSLACIAQNHDVVPLAQPIKRDRTENGTQSSCVLIHA